MSKKEEAIKRSLYKARHSTQPAVLRQNIASSLLPVF